MLRAMRKSADNIFMKGLLFLLALAFASWGIGSWLAPGAGGEWIVSVGGDKISRASVEQQVQNRLYQLGQITGVQYGLNSEEARIYREEALNREIERALFRKRAADLGITPGMQTLADAIAGNSGFYDENGNFSEERFDALLRQNGFTKSAFFAQQRHTVASNILQQVFFGYVPDIPAAAVDKVSDFRLEERKAAAVAIPVIADEAESAPSDTDIIDTYQANKQDFAAPEYRTFTFLALTPEDAKQSIGADDEALKAYFSGREDQYRIPERRTLDRYVFSDEEEAKKAVEALQNGADPSAYESAKKAEETREQAEMFADFGEQVFAAEKGGFAGPLQSPFGWFVYHVKDIAEERPGAFEDVKERVREDYVAEELELRFPEFIASAEDKLAEGADVAAVAEALKMTPVTLTLDASGQPVNGLAPEATEEPYFSAVLARVFAEENKGVPSELFAAGNSGAYAVYELEGIIEERIKSVDEVRGIVITMWKEDARRAQLEAAVAAALSGENAQDGEKLLQALSEEYGAPVEEISVTRPYEGAPAQPSDTVSDALAASLFAAEKGALAYAHSEDANTVTVAMLKDTVSAREAAGATKIRELRKEWRESFLYDFREQYLAFLKQHYPVTYNSDAGAR